MRSRQLRQNSICQFSTCSWSFCEDVTRYKKNGFDSIGVWRRKVEDFGFEKAIDVLYESKLSVSSLHWAGGFTGAEQSREQALDDTYQAIRLAARINANCLLVHSGGMNGHIFPHINKVVREAYAEVMCMANDYSVDIAIEPMLGQPHSPWTIYRSIDELLSLLDQFPKMKVCLDLYQVGLHDEAFDRLEEYVDRVKVVQLSDRTFESWNRGQQFRNRRFSYRLPLGEGDVAIDHWVERLLDLGYEGPFELEVHGQMTRPTGHRRLLQRTKNYFQSVEV